MVVSGRKGFTIVEMLAVIGVIAVLLSIIVTAASGDTLGIFLHVVLVIVSTPMFCAGRWVLSLFLWAFLMIAAFRLGRK